MGNFVRLFFLAFIFSFLSSSIALSETYYDDEIELTEMFDPAFDKGEYIENDPSYPGGGKDRFRCELVIIVVNVNKRFESQRHSVFATGRSWSDSRGRAFQDYGRWIGQNRFWGSQFRHSFYFNNCF